MKIFSVITIVVLNIILSNCKSKAEPATAAVDQNIESLSLDTEIALKEIETLSKSIRNWVQMVRTNIEPNLNNGITTGEVYQYVNSLTYSLKFLSGFEQIAAEVIKTEDLKARNTIIAEVVRQYLVLSLKLENRVKGHIQYRKLFPEMKLLLDGADKECEAIRKLCNNRLKVLGKTPELKKYLNEFEILELSKIDIDL